MKHNPNLHNLMIQYSSVKVRGEDHYRDTLSKAVRIMVKLNIEPVDIQMRFNHTNEATGELYPMTHFDIRFKDEGDLCSFKSYFLSGGD
jgi:hypothetical protein